MYICENCGYRSHKWLGKCPECGEWNSFREIDESNNKKSKKTRLTSKKPFKLQGSSFSGEYFHVSEHFDKFFGKGIVKGGTYLISGAPGVGKSTLLLDIAKKLSENGVRCVYVSAEESLEQLSLRAQRTNCLDIYALDDSDVFNIVDLIESKDFDCVIVDSIHAIYSHDISSSAGSIVQVKYASGLIVGAAKKNNVCVFLVAHVTKEGFIAGPKTLEHVVDVVSYLDDDLGEYRLLKNSKNRFGPTDEALMFEMKDDGLYVLDDPTVRFISKNLKADGCVYGVELEGQMPLVVEIQALCVQSALGIPRRVCVGFDLNRLNMILAVIEKRLKIPMYKFDVYVNVVGGIKISSTIADASLACALISSIKKKSIGSNAVIAGEIDLSGSIRLHERLRKPLANLKNLGFLILSPFDGLDNINKVKELI